MTAAARRASFPADPARRAMYAKLALARKELGLSEEDYRAVLLRETGKASASAMSVAELDTAIAAFKRQGWQQKAATRASRPADHPSAKKARALWISLHQLGVVRNASDSALEAFARRQLRCDRLQWADQAQVYRLVEALKAMAERAGWSQDVAGIEPDRQTLVLLQRLVKRLHALLEEATGGECDSLNGYAMGYPGAGSGWLNLWPANLRRLAATLAHALAQAREG